MISLHAEWLRQPLYILPIGQFIFGEKTSGMNTAMPHDQAVKPPSLVRGFARLHLNQSWVWWNAPDIPARAGRIKQEDCGPGQPKQKLSFYYQKNKSK
jgi:hypothetical protein